MGARQPKHASSDVHYGGADDGGCGEAGDKDYGGAIALNVPSLCTAGNTGWALPMNVASMWGFSLENGGVSKSGVPTVTDRVREVYWLRPLGVVSPGAVGARTACVWSRGRRRTKLRTGVRDFRHGTSSGEDDVTILLILILGRLGQTAVRTAQPDSPNSATRPASAEYVAEL